MGSNLFVVSMEYRHKAGKKKGVMQFAVAAVSSLDARERVFEQFDFSGISIGRIEVLKPLGTVWQVSGNIIAVRKEDANNESISAEPTGVEDGGHDAEVSAT